MGNIGLVSDIHSNPWGAESVIEFLRARGFPKDQTINLGDTVGMFPEVIPSLELARSESKLHLMGNHDAVLLGLFEDDPERQERIMAINQNKETLNNSGRTDLIDWLRQSPADYSLGNIRFVHNSPFGRPDTTSRDWMLARVSPALLDPSSPNYSPMDSKLLELSNSTHHLIFRGHAHEGSIYRVKRGLKKAKEGMIELVKMGRGNNWLEVDIDPDFVYLVTSGSACGANTLFTKSEELDYRPSGGFVEYEHGTQRGRVVLFRTIRGYQVDRFIQSVKSATSWRGFEEAQKQITALGGKNALL